MKNQLNNTKALPIIQRNLINKSFSNDFDEARTEWVYETDIAKGGEHFSTHCELCNQRLYNENYVIRNEKTGSHLQVGSSCITRFVLINGLTNSEDVSNFIKNIRKERTKDKEIHTLFSILRNPRLKRGPAAETRRFKNLLTESLRNRGKEDWLDKYEKLELILKEIIGLTSITERDLKVLDCIIINAAKFIKIGI